MLSSVVSASGTERSIAAGRQVEPTGHAPGAPGIEPTWTSSAKDLVGCSIGAARVWFTLGHGIVNEVYYPRVDIPQIRDLGFIVADGKGFWVEVKRLANYRLCSLEPGAPVVEIVHSHTRFTLTLRVGLDGDRDVLVVDLDLDGDAGLKAYALLAPRLGSAGHDNVARIERHGGRRVLAAEQGPFGLALAAVDGDGRDALGPASAGYVGASDGWQDFSRDGRLVHSYAEAGPGNVALVAEVAPRSRLALGFGTSSQAAATLAISSLMQPAEEIFDTQLRAWRGWHALRDERALVSSEAPAVRADEVALSAMVLRAHCDKTYPGAMTASLTVPWGNSRDDRGGYHLVWPRDLVECATALLALGAVAEARDTLRYLIATQKEDGGWYQNQWLGGTPYWQGTQLDEAALPVLLAAALAERGALGTIPVADMVCRALAFIARNGPASPQDRWEENPGINAFTLAAAIAALVCGAPFLKPAAAKLALALADFWNARIEDWLTAGRTELAERHGLSGYYVRIAPAAIVADRNCLSETFEIRNVAEGSKIEVDDEIGTDFLQLVRFGLRAADDPLIIDSVKLVDARLKTETPRGSVWHRYNGDGYGEHDDGSPFDGTGRGRGWPLLTGERGHYELAAGRDVTSYLDAMVAMTGSGGMMPEQVWDADPLPERGFYPGLPTGSAMPLAWAHAEFLKLVASHHLGHAVDRPAAVWQRYAGQRPAEKVAIFTPAAPISRLHRGASLILAVNEAATMHVSLDGWKMVADVATTDSGLGLHIVEIAAASLANAKAVDFTWRVAATGAWTGRDFRIEIVD